MGKQRQEEYWHRLDNAAKVFPAVRSSSNSSVFRVGAKLTEKIDPQRLQRAVEEALEELPTFKVKLRKGLFWYYWETNFQKPIVQEDSAWPLRKIDKRQNNGYMFRFTYFERKINLEVFHALTDGTGAMVLLKSVLYCYLKQLYPDKVTWNELVSDTGFSQHALDEDSFLRLRKMSRTRQLKRKPAYQMKGTRYLGEQVDLTQGIVSAEQIVKQSKQMGVTVTAYLASLLMYAIYQNNYKYHAEDRPITFSIPINLRGFFKSETIRNFFSFITVSLNFYEQDYSFEQVCTEVARQMKEALQVQNITARIARNLAAERNLAVRFIPLAIKNLCLRAIYLRNEKTYTSTISNLGRIHLPQEQKPFVERMESANNLTKRQCFKVCVCSLGDAMTISFVSGLEDKDVERYFFRYLARQGVDVQITCNQEADEEP